MAYTSDDPRPSLRPEATRKGDDDPRPCRPPEDDLKRVLEEREKLQQKIAAAEASRRLAQEEEEGADEIAEGEEPRGRTLKKLIVHSCRLLVGLWLCNVFYSVIRNVLVAQTRAELILAVFLLAATVAVFAFIVIYAWSLFAWLPRIVSVAEAKYKGNTFKLMEKIRGDYLARLPTREEYAGKLRVAENDDLILRLETLRTRQYADSTTFLEDFRAFQALQDRQAAVVIKKYALLIAVKTAASPWRIVDMMAVFFNSTLMVCEIAGIYNRRISRPQAFRLLVGWTLNLYVSGELGQAMKGATDTLNNNLSDMLGSDGVCSLAQPFLPLFSKLVGKAVEGGANAYFAYRLGKQSVISFRYLQGQ